MNQFLVTKKGDMLCSPFQCDRCWFINLKNREPKQHQSDTRLMMYIRRVNLDMLRSRETSTVEKSLSQYNKAKGWANEMGIRMNMDQAIKTRPMGDNIGSLYCVTRWKKEITQRLIVNLTLFEEYVLCPPTCTRVVQSMVEVP